ncbi:collagen alpha-6(VI) chain-like [Montipora capricornis]|uniref:collagen alpha-6(VI) chain-like n=1 Tax=Montipora capricornis TaxID=246305 RepID=UPI0035F1ECB8
MSDTVGSTCRAQVDLGFIIDGSGSIESYGKGNFHRCLQFVQAVVRRFNTDNGQTRIGVVLFSFRPRLIFDFKRYRNKGQILRAISRIRYPRGGTKTGRAMRFAYYRLFRYARPVVRRVAIVMTDGKSYDNVATPGRMFRRKGIKCYAVGIGKRFNRRQLLQITGGARNQVVTSRFRRLGSIVGAIGRGACRGGRPIRPPRSPPPGRACRAQVDLGFIIDGSGSIESYGKGNFHRCLQFVQAVVRRFNTDNGQTRIGVVLFSFRPRLIFDFKRYRNKGQILRAISRIRYPRGGTKTGRAMRFAYYRLFRYARPVVRKVAIVMTDGKSYDNVATPGRMFRRKGIKCYAVGIGKRFNRRQLLQITGGARNQVVTSRFRRLGSIVGAIGRGACRAFEQLGPGNSPFNVAIFLGGRPIRPPRPLPPGRVCRARLDLAFIIDGSGSIEFSGKGNFRRCLNFVRTVVSKLNTNNGETRIAAVLFSSKPRVIFGFTRYRKKAQILNAINRIRYPRGGTKTGWAMRYTYSRVFRQARRRVRKVAIVMTDGRSYDRVAGPGQQFRRKNIICYAVGIGRRFNRRQLVQIAAGNRRRVVTVGFKGLQSIAGTIARGACTGRPPIRPPRPPPPPGKVCRARVDLAFIIDGSGSIEYSGKGNFRRCLNFVRAVVSQFNMRSGQSRFAAVVFSSKPRLIFGFTRYRRKAQILNAINRIRYPRGGTKTGWAMRYTYSRVFRRARRGVRKVCIVMTDGRSYDSVVGPGRFLQRKRIQCYAVGIGRNYNRNQLLQITAGNRRRVVTASFRNLQSVVRTISRGVCGGTAIVTKRWRMVETRLVQPPNLPLLTFC